MRDEEYCEIMLEAYRDVLHKILLGYNSEDIQKYINHEIKFHVEWAERAGSE